jgi:hypothetical protein
MTLNQFKNIVVGFTVLAITMSGFIESASAQARRIFRVSGQSVNQSEIQFDLNTDIFDSNPDVNSGLFKGSINNYNRSISDDSYDQGMFGDINVSKLTTDSLGNVSNLRLDNDNEITLQELSEIFSEQNNNGLDINFNSNDIIRYDVNFTRFTKVRSGELESSVAPQLIWFVQSKDTSLINNLSGLSQFQTIFGILASEVTGGTTFSVTLSPTKIPESSNTLGLITIGTIAGLSYFKRVNHQISK